MLIDNHGRNIDYIRLAVTDRCNLRCNYCMPASGIQFLKRNDLLTYEEMLRILTILSKNGVNKIRITGGEPFLRKDIMGFLKSLSDIETINKIAITTNGTLTRPYLSELIALGIRSFNLSIDSIDKTRFERITRRTCFDEVWACYEEMKEATLDLKVNAVVLKDQNIDDIIPMVALGETDNVSIRFIEEMPFNGDGNFYPKLEWNYEKIYHHIETHFGTIKKLPDPKGSTSLNYQVEGFKGTFGIIPAYTRSFCGSCNRIRLTPKGTIKTCLYDDGIFNIKDIMRAGATDIEILQAIKEAIGHRAIDGFEAEKNRSNRPTISESMASIGG